MASMIKETGLKVKNDTLEIKFSHVIATGTRVTPIFKASKRIKNVILPRMHTEVQKISYLYITILRYFTEEYVFALFI